jgi:tetratricopeptide (TPR) repeat protein
VKRPVIAVATVAALVAAAFLVWTEVRREREFRRLIAVGDAALAQDQTFAAVEAFSGAITLKPDSMLAHLKRAETYRRRGDRELAAALRDAREANALDPTAPQPIELLGDINSAMGRHERASEHYQRYLSLEDRTPRVYYKLAVAHFRNGQPARAIEPLRKAAALDDRLVEAHYLLGVTLRSQNRSDEALAALQRAVAINGTFIAAREELADLYQERGDERNAVQQLEAIAALEPGRPERLVNVGLMYAQRGHQDAAIVTLGRAAERYPGEAVVYSAIGRVWLETATSHRDPVAASKAVEALAPIAGRTDATSDMLTLLGRAFLVSGKAADAERTLQQATTRRPVDPDAFRYLADAARRLGHASVAADAEARFAVLVPAN